MKLAVYFEKHVGFIFTVEEKIC